MSNTQEAAEQGQPMLAIEEAGVTYRKGREQVTALRQVSFSLMPGEFVTVTGPSGSGKSTFLQLCGGILAPTAGVVRFMGNIQQGMADRDLALLRSKKIGFVFQSFNLLDYLSAEENVALPLLLAGMPEQERLVLARQRLDALGLGHRRGHYPAELSGGECQRVAIARALASSPPLLIADEPTGNLDHESSAVVMEIFAGIHRAQSATILLVTHSPWVAGFGSRSIRIEEGRLT